MENSPFKPLVALLISSALIIVLIGKPKHSTQPKNNQLPQLETKITPSPTPIGAIQTHDPSSTLPKSPVSAAYIVSQILSKTAPAEERREALYQLTQTHSDAATQSLIEIAASNIEIQDESSRFDVSLRITALEAIDQRMASGEASATAINTVLEKQKHPTLLFFARISLEGVTSGHPGKLTRFIDRAFSEVGAG